MEESNLKGSLSIMRSIVVLIFLPISFRQSRISAQWKKSLSTMIGEIQQRSCRRPRASYALRSWVLKNNFKIFLFKIKK